MSEQVNDTLGSGPLVAWLGDDFTGAAAVMEVLTFAGLPAVLFLDTPNAEQQARFPDLRGIGIASMARTRDPDWMDAHLPALFDTLAATGAPLIHYKICSTLDSAPGIGSIGRAMEIGARRFDAASVPVVTAAPRMRRHQVFGHLFAGAPDGVHRLDRHPVMSRHPVTPMTESDVARHIAAQTDMPMHCLDLEHLADPGDRLDTPGGWTIDMATPADETRVGRLLWERRAKSPFVIGSQGVEYALTAHFREAGLLPPVRPVPGIGAAPRMAVVSGSVSPTTAAQIAWARDHGFATIAFDAATVCAGPEALARAEAAAVTDALAALEAGRPALVHSAEGPDDPAVAHLREVAGPDGLAGANDRIGAALGRILRRLIDTAGLSRAVVSGGDTSGHVCRELGIYALTALAPTIPGASICTAHADGAMDGLELALKGGQMGSPDYFGWVRDGGGDRE